MDSEKDALLNLIFPDGYPAEWQYNVNFKEYITKLGSYTSDDLCKEPQKLREEKLITQELTQELAVSNYKTFIQTAECSRKSFKHFNMIEEKLDGLLENVPKFEAKYLQFIEDSNGINNLRKLNSITLTRNAQLLEILELPQLMDSFIKDHFYEDALELSAYVQKLYVKHPDVPIFKTIVNEVDKLWYLMLHQLLQQLRADIQLPKCLQIVGHLRRMGVFSESELRLKFLQARNHWLQTSLDIIPRNDANQHLSKTIEITRVNLFSIITQYRAVFNDDEHSPLVTSKNQTVNQNCIFFCWIKQKISEFLITLEYDLQQGIASIDSFLGQCMYFGLSFSKVGCDFRLLMLPIFLRAIKVNFKTSIAAASRDFETNMERFTLINKNHPKVQWKNKSTDLMQPPDSLLEFYPLANYVNKILTSFNTLRLCAPITIIDDVIACIEESLLVVSSGIYILYGQEHQAFTANAKDAFTRLCMAFADDLVPYLQKALHVIYPPNNIAQYLGVNVQVLQDEGISFLNRERIIENIKTLLPAKIKPSISMASEKEEVIAILEE